MRGLNWQLAATGVAASLVLGGVALASPTAAAPIKRCNTTVDARPVVLAVHGLAGFPSDFGKDGEKNTMNVAIDSVSRVKRVDAFDYHDYAKKWVTDEHLGAALAKQINCLSAASREAGGNGKIAVVSNSLGSLVLRQALNQSAPTHTSPSKVGLAVMIGSPHKGTYAAVAGLVIYWDCKGQICQPSAAVKALIPPSRRLALLPPLPRTVPQRAIATDIIKGSVHLGDTIVSVSSATAEYTTRYRGDGKVVINCTPSQTVPCMHGNLLKNAKVQEAVVRSLNEYAPRPAATPTPSPTPTPTPTSTCTPAPSPTPSEEANGGTGGGPTVTPSEPACV